MRVSHRQKERQPGKGLNSHLGEAGEVGMSCAALNSTFLLHPVDPQWLKKGGLPGFPTQLDIVRRSGAKGFLGHRFRARPQPTLPNC